MASGEVEVQNVVQACIRPNYLLVSLYVSILRYVVNICGQVSGMLLVYRSAIVARLYHVVFRLPATWSINLLIEATIKLFDPIGTIK